MKKVIGFVAPIAIYFVVEYFGGPLWGMVAGCVLSVIGLIASRVRGSSLTWGSFGDLGLVVLLGLVDIATERLGRAGIGEAAFALIMFGLLRLCIAGKIDMMPTESVPMLKRIYANPFNRSNLADAQRRMSWWCLAVAAVYLCVAVGKPGSAMQWIDSYALVIIGAAFFATELVLNRMRMRKYRHCEWVPLVDEQANVLGNCPRPLVHNGSHWLHPVVHLHIISNRRLLLQLRPITKKIQPGKWDTAVGGHIAAGEKIEDALGREAWEETGIRGFRAQLCKRYVWRCEAENEYVFSFCTEHDGPFVPRNGGEVDELRLWSADELRDALGRGIFTPNLEDELKKWVLERLEQ